MVVLALVPELLRLGFGLGMWGKVTNKCERRYG